MPWNDVFIRAQKELGIPQRTIKGTVLIETILASFEMDEILYELRDHSAGLNCGRWDYIFSFIQKFANDVRAVLPDRAQVTMTTHFMRSYSKLAIVHSSTSMTGSSHLLPQGSSSNSQTDRSERLTAQLRMRSKSSEHAGPVF